MQNKKGVDAVVATVLIIMITVAAVAIIWFTLIPMIKNSASSSTEERVSLSIETDAGYTVYDPSTGQLSVQIKRGVDKAEIKAIQIIVSNGKYTQNNTKTDVLLPNSVKTYFISLVNLGAPVKISVSPIFSDGKEGAITSEISIIKEGTVSLQQAQDNGAQDIVTGQTAGDIWYFDDDCDGYYNGTTIIALVRPTSSGCVKNSSEILSTSTTDANDNNKDCYEAVICGLRNGLVSYWTFDSDQVPNISANKIINWSNGTINGTETFSSSGINISIANNSVGAGGIVSNAINLTSGKTFKLTMNFNSISGALPQVRVVGGMSGRENGSVTYYLPDAFHGSYAAYISSSWTGSLRNIEISYPNTSFGAFNLTNATLVEYSSSTAIDSMNKNNGSYVSNAFADSSGKIGKSLSLDGSGDYITLKSTAPYTTAMTFSSWFKLASTTSPNQQAVFAMYRQLGEFKFTTQTIYAHSDISGFYITSPWTPNTNWNLLTMTMSNIQDNKINMSIYLNGLIIKNQNVTGQLNTTNAYNHIGSWGTSRSFNGSLDEVAFWNRSLTAAEISQIYNSGSGKSLNQY